VSKLVPILKDEILLAFYLDSAMKDDARLICGKTLRFLLTIGPSEIECKITLIHSPSVNIPVLGRQVLYCKKVTMRAFFSVGIVVPLSSY
jgi:hypothetical protein